MGERKMASKRKQIEKIIVINRKYEKGKTEAIDLFAKLTANNIINSGQKQLIQNNDYCENGRVPKESY